MRASVPSKPYPRIRRIVRGWVDGLTRIGVQGQFYFQTLISIREAFARYNVEMVRVIAQMSLGTGGLAIIGGSVVIVGFLTLSTGALAGYNEFACSRTRAWCHGRPIPPTPGPR
jgi:phospholipid/cholesterol/gamma-HCH transport system permease protein